MRVKFATSLAIVIMILGLVLAGILPSPMTATDVAPAEAAACPGYRAYVDGTCGPRNHCLYRFATWRTCNVYRPGSVYTF
jgi:hypothetical protein